MKRIFACLTAAALALVPTAASAHPADPHPADFTVAHAAALPPQLGAPKLAASVCCVGHVNVQSTMPVGIWTEGWYYSYKSGSTTWAGITVSPGFTTANVVGGTFDPEREYIGDCWAVNMWYMGVQTTYYGPRWIQGPSAGGGDQNYYYSWAWRTC
jgi:hypothetical protein